jgi:hypothetical protein
MRAVASGRPDAHEVLRLRKDEASRWFDSRVISRGILTLLPKYAMCCLV